MASFVVYQKYNSKELRKVAKQTIEGIKKWFKFNPGRKVCHAKLWYGTTRDIKRTDDVDQIINGILAETLAQNKEPKKQVHKYKVGDIVGICADCMADCEILKCIPKKKGQTFTYIATAVNIHHPNPEQSFFGQNKKFLVREKQIVVKLR